MDGGNNANIRPNHRLYYLETILPIVRKVAYSFERYFGFELAEDVTRIPALQPELRDQAAYYATLVNTGIISPNEAREALGKEPVDGFDEPRVLKYKEGENAWRITTGRLPRTNFRRWTWSSALGQRTTHQISASPKVTRLLHVKV